MKKKISIGLFTIGLFVGITYGVVSIIVGGNFDYSESVVLKENQQYSIEEKVGNGCYEVGFYSKDKFFYSPMHQPYTFRDSQFEVVFLNNKNEEIKKTTIDSNSGLQHGFAPGIFGSETTNVALDLIKSPLNGSYSLKILIKIDKLANNLQDKEVYLYLRKYAKNCDPSRLDYMNKKHTYPIKRKETNTTLVPLYDALIAKDTQKVKNIINANTILCNANFIGDRTLFHYSAFYNDLPTLQYIAKVCGTSALHKEDILQKTPIRYAIENNATKVLDFLFEHGGECPEVIENIYLKDYVGGGISYKRATSGQNIAMFVHEYNLLEVADILLKYQCMDANEKREQFGREITWTEMMERYMLNKDLMIKQNDKRWKSQKDYTELIGVFEKYSKQNLNSTEGINDIKQKETNATLVPLYDALIAKDTQKVKNIINTNTILCNANFIGNRTLFHYSAFYNDIDTLQYLNKKCGISLLNKKDILKKTPIVYATENNASGALDFLLKHSAECPQSIENTYLKNYVGEGIDFKKDAWGRSIAMFVYKYNLPDVADVLFKNKCMDTHEKRKNLGNGITWTEMMEKYMLDTKSMIKENDKRWKSRKDYTKLIEVFKKYTKQDINATQRINNGR